MDWEKVLLYECQSVSTWYIKRFYFKRSRKILFTKICPLYLVETTYIKEISEPDINRDDETDEATEIAARVTSFMSSDTHTHTHTHTKRETCQNVEQLQIEDIRLV